MIRDMGWYFVQSIITVQNDELYQGTSFGDGSGTWLVSFSEALSLQNLDKQIRLSYPSRLCWCQQKSKTNASNSKDTSMDCPSLDVITDISAPKARKWGSGNIMAF